MADTEVKEKKPVCFVIMPIADIHGYEQGHFGRVYEYLLKPAIVKAGFEPIRADDAVKTDYIVVSIIQQIVESEMVICDFSARNPNVMYELGIRHAFNKPVVLIKDRRTDKIFDIQGLRYMDYDESLRIDTVQKDIAKITSSIIETSKNDEKSINSVVQLAGIKAADIPATQQISGETQLIITSLASLERKINNISGNSSKVTKNKYFTVSKEKVVTLSDGTVININEDLCDPNNKIYGVLSDVDFGTQSILITAGDGSQYVYRPDSEKSSGLSSLPF